MKRKGKNNIEKSQVCQAHIDKSMIKHDRKTIKSKLCVSYPALSLRRYCR